MSAYGARLVRVWSRFWMRWAGPGPGGRFACRLAALRAPPYYARHRLARLHPQGYFGRAELAHPDLCLGDHVFIDDRVLVYRDIDGGPVFIGSHVHLHRDTIVQTGQGGRISIGDRSSIQARCHFAAYVGAIDIGQDVQIAPNCAFYSYNHTTERGTLMRDQPLKSSGGIVLGNDVWLGSGVTVLDGASIGDGAVIAAGAVVRGEIPPQTVAGGIPARVLRERARQKSDFDARKAAGHG